MSVKRWGIGIFVVFVLALTAVGAFINVGQAQADGVPCGDCGGEQRYIYVPTTSGNPPPNLTYFRLCNCGSGRGCTIGVMQSFTPTESSCLKKVVLSLAWEECAGGCINIRELNNGVPSDKILATGFPLTQGPMWQRCITFIFDNPVPLSAGETYVFEVDIHDYPCDNEGDHFGWAARTDNPYGGGNCFIGNWDYNLNRLVWQASYNIDMCFSLYGCAPAPSWSFAVITDLHIGEGYCSDSIEYKCTGDDYGTVGWNDSEDSGQETYQECYECPVLQPTPSLDICCWENTYSTTENLKDVIGLINSSVGEYNIKFVVVDGDLTNSAEISELDKARDMLDGLAVPWIPLLGNHDVWPYTKTDTDEAPGIDQDGNGPDKWANNILFESQYQKLTQDYPDWEWERGPTRVYNKLLDTPSSTYFQNFAFDYGGYHFIGLDFNDRYRWSHTAGVHPRADLFVTDWDPFTTLVDGTWDWFKSNLGKYVDNSGEEDVILLAHHPMTDFFYGWRFGVDDQGFGLGMAFTRAEILHMYNLFLNSYSDRICAEFVGHLHRNKKYQSLNDVMDIYETDANKEGGGQVRIVTLHPGNSEQPLESKLLTPYKSAETSYGSPYMSITDPLNRVVNWSVNEIPGAEYRQFDFDGDGKLDAQILLPENVKMEDYTIQVFPYEGVTSNDTYTLVVSPAEEQFGYTDIVLAANQSFENESYTFQFKDRIATNLSYTGDFSGYFGDAVSLSATLTDNSSTPLSGKTIYLWLGNQSVSAVTDSGGNASAQLVLDQPPSEFYTFGADFTGDADYLPSYNISYFEILSPYDKDWSCWKQGIVAANETIGDLTSYQMELTLHYGPGSSNGSDVYLANNASSDFSDVRFLDEYRLTPLDYWVQDYTANDKATVWVEFNNISTMGTFFYIYYGNPSAGSASNGSNTFVFYEPFNDLSAWNVVGGCWSASDGVCHQLGGGNTWEGGLTLNSPPTTDSRKVSCNMKIVHSSGNRYVAFGAKKGDGFLHCELRKEATPVQRCQANSGGWKTVHDASCDIGYQTWQRLTVGVDGGGNVTTWVDGAEKNNFTDPDWDKTWTGVSLYTFYTMADFDDLFVANYYDPEPSWGTWTEAYPTPTPTVSPTPTATPSSTPVMTATPSPNGSDWSQHQKGSVTANSTCGDLSTYQMELSLHYGNGTSSGSDIYLANNASSNFSDIRFTEADGETLLDYWVQKYTESDVATVWVEFDAISTSGTDFYIYYGNPGASSASNGSNTFVFYEPFNDLSAWNVVGGCWSASDGVCHQLGGGNTWEGGLTLNLPPTTDSRRVSCNMKIVDSSGSRYVAFGAKKGDGFLHCELRKEATPVQRCHAKDGTWKTVHDIGCDISYQTWQRLTVGVNGSGYVKTWFDGVEKQSFVDPDWDKTWPGVSLYTFYTMADFDDLFVANYCDPEPTFGNWE